MKIIPYSKIKPFLYNKFSLVAIFLSLYSLLIYYLQISIYPLRISFLIFMAVSYFFWTGLGFLFKIIPQKISVILRLFLSFSIVVLILSAPQFFSEFKEFLSTGIVILLKEQPVYFWGYVRQTLTDINMLSAIVLLSLLLWYLLRPATVTKHKVKYAVIGLIMIFFANLTINTQRTYFQTQFLPVDVHSFYAIRYGLKNKDIEKPLKHILSENWDKDLPQTRENWNIVLVVFESLSRVPLPFYGYDNNYMPFMTNWIQQEKDRFLLFKNALTLSGATDVSMPSIYTGIGPQEDYQKLVTAPFIWDYAHKAGYETMAINSQSQEWKQMKNFVHDAYLDHYYYPEKLGMKFYNDIGTDDLSLIKKIEKNILQLHEPFFIYYNTNATHGPLQQTSPQLTDYQDIKDKYGRALYITDQTVKALVAILKKKGVLNRTIFIFTADHGNYTVKRRARTSSFFKETLDIPFMIRLPETWIKKHPDTYQILKKNTIKRVANTDIAPSIFHFIFGQKPEKQYFGGKSLLTPIDNKRIIISLSTNDTRHWNREGFGIYTRNESFIYHDNTGFHFYNVKIDSLQQNDMIENIPPERRRFYDSIIKQNQYLQRVIKRTRHN